jgi:hypothetical protein
MCVIVYKPSDIDIDMVKLRQCWDRNGDGAGMMFADEEKLRVAKGFMKWRSFKRYMKREGMEKLNSLPIIFHFRIATHGTISPLNCHPFRVNGDLAMAHNGIMQNVDIPDGKDISDSEAFLNRYVRDAFSTISIEALSSGMPINELLAKFIGGSKLAFMDNRGEVAIVNERSGTWLEGAWYSNMIWKPYKRTTTPIGKPATTTKKPVSGGYGYGNGMQATKFSPKLVEELDDWYCFDCHCYFSLGEARRSYWTNGMKERLVDCPECSSPDTTEVGDEMFDDKPSEKGDLPWDIRWKCYDCEESFDEDSAEMHVFDGEGRCICPFCKGNRTFEVEWQDTVDRFGASFFMPQTYDLTKGGGYAKK